MNFTAVAGGTPNQVLLGAIAGKVHGGQQPISGAAVYLYAAGTGGYGTAATSLLTSVAGQTIKDGSGNFFTATQADGSFSLTGDYTCTAGTQVYVISMGGNPGSGVNSAAGLMAVLGQCPAGGSLAASVPYVTVNEVSTVAAAYSLAAFATDATHVASSGTPLAKAGLANATLGAANLYNVANGVSGALTLTPAGNGTVPQAEINTLANALAGCVNSAGPDAGACTVLFNAVRSGGAVGNMAVDTAALAINIAHNPGWATQTVFTSAAGLGAPFQPSLSKAPNDFTVGIDYIGGGLDRPQFVAVDGQNNIWLANNTSVTELTGTGVPITGLNGYTAGKQNGPGGLAIDAQGDVWVTDSNQSAVTELSVAGTLLTGGTGYSLSSQTGPYGIAIDAGGNAWITDSGTSALTELSGSGSLLQGGLTGSGLGYPVAVAVDTSGNTWTVNAGDNSVSEMTGAGAALSGPNGYSGGGLNFPSAIAIDGGGNIWIANLFGSSVTKLSSSGAVVSSSGYTGGGLYFPTSIAVDGAGHIWVANNSSSLTELASDGTILSGANGFMKATLAEENSLGIDGSGNLWVTNGVGVTELVGVAGPVVTPLVAATVTSQLGQRP